MLRDLLKKIGLNETESEVYLAVLGKGKVLPSSISKQTNIKRSTVYSAAEELIKKGILEKDLSGKSTYYVATSSDTIENYVEQEKRDLLERMEAAKDLVKEIDALPKSKKYSVPRIQFIEGEEVVKFIYKQTPIWWESMISTEETTWWGFQDHTILELSGFKKWIVWFWDKAPAEINLKLFSNEEKIEKQFSKEKTLPKRNIKFWDGEPFTASQMIIGDYVVNISTDQDPAYLVQIHDKVLAKNLRNLYKKLWKESK